MFARLRRQFRRFFRQAHTVKQEPVNRASLAVIILIDLFVLFNVFSGLDDIGRWPLSPDLAYPCHSSWVTYRQQTQGDRDFDAIQRTARFATGTPLTWATSYRQATEGHLGQLSPICLDVAATADGLDSPENRAIFAQIEETRRAIAALEQENQTIRSQYDSTLLEQIAGQPQDQSINQVEASQARATLERNDARLVELRQQQGDQQRQIAQTPSSQSFLALLNNDAQFQALDRQFQRSSFWYPSVQLLFQAAFLLPLIGLAWGIHRAADRRGYGLVALQSWHLLVIFCIPLVVKVFELLQFGALFVWLSQVLIALLGGLLFLINYLYILLVPLVGYGIIKVFQNLVFNPQRQAAGRVQNQKCLRCAKKLQPGDTHCPHCGFQQHTDCPQCHQPTYKYLSHCRHCGAGQE